MNLRIPLASPDITEAEIEAVVAVMRTSSLSLGPKLDEFEHALAAYHAMPDAIAVSSGTAALHLALRALDIREGDEVVVPSFTFIAVASVITYERAVPVFVDIDPITLNIDPQCVKAAITARTRAIIVVHNFGVPADMDALLSIAREHHLFVIEDACEAIGATYNDQRIGTFGDLSVIAFYPNKQITTGEGGAVLTRDPRVADRIRALRNQGRYPSSEWFQHSEIGYNYRLSEMACALGIIQLSRLPDILAQRTRVAGRYDTLLASINGVDRPPLMLPSLEISWFVYVVRLAEGLGPDARDEILRAMQEQGIGCARYFAPIHLQPAFEDSSSAKLATLPITESVARRTLALPFFNKLSPGDAEEVAKALSTAIESVVRSN